VAGFLYELPGKNCGAFAILRVAIFTYPVFKGGAIDETDIKGLLLCVKQKEDIISQVKKVDEELRPFRDEWQKRKDEMSEYSRRQCEKYVGELNTILEKLMLLEGENEKMLADRVTKLEKDLQNIQKGKQAQQSYFKDTNGKAQFIDKKK
jgi:hypothetical protein